ncbi:LptC-related lipopolysaccharide-assembly protein [Vitreoscilla sp. C1]|uniref:LPS export ABC transporter periplasmic protein LptC n=1 Tax=Vitreoscilla sp. (strain C1) TaxID=96942 RepID=UPI000CDC0A55|nr:LPS export ABC transporter periplasmic protein LptC [Vitreoscilla sp. C1]AUZ05495.1 LptC-related lipopolysaccharide-assembly protein [Vitreoscilla sp. C1]
MNISSRMMPLVFPMVLAVLMGGMTFWLNRATDVNVETTLLDLSQPQYVMKDISGLRFDAQGLPVQTLVAKEASMYPNSNDVLLQQPDGQVWQQGQPLYRVSSQEARYADQEEKIFFKQEVVLTKTAVDGGLEGKVSMPTLTVDIPTQMAHTDAEVQYEYGQSHGSAVGFSYDKKNDVLNLQSRVKAIIYDEQP